MEVRFSVTSYAAWTDSTPSLQAMPAMLRRRVSSSGKMALEVSYQCLDKMDIPTVFCSRHGECERAAQLLSDLVSHTPISPTTFSLSVHNATSGLFSIARKSQENTTAIAASHSTIAHGVIEACGLLADKAPAVLLVAYDTYLPEIFKPFQEAHEHPFAFAWLIQTPDENAISLSWSASLETPTDVAGKKIYDFFIHKKPLLEHISQGKHWQWKHLNV